MSGSSSIIAGSFNPPAITELDPSEGLPPSILLEARAYFDDRKNSTTATLDTGKGRSIQVSICFADPPALSYVRIHCPGYTESDFSDEPRVVRSEKQFLLLHLSLWGTGFEEQVDEYYMYQAIRGEPKLFRIPDLGPSLRSFFSLDDFGIYCCDDGECILAGLTYSAGGYQLRSYSSASKVWTVRPAQLQLEELLPEEHMPVAAHKVILLGGSLLGWVDLWKGILVCDVLCQDPKLVVGFIPLPLTGNTYNHICPWVIRDVTCTNGSLKFIEIGHLPVPPAADVNGAPDVMCDGSYFISPPDDLETEPYKFVDWRATMWNRFLSDKLWRKGFEVHGNDILVEELVGCTVGVSTVGNLLPFFPTLSVCGDDVVHMSSFGRLDMAKTQMISIDMSNNTLKALAPCHPVDADDDCPYFPCVLSNYLSNPPGAPVSRRAKTSGILSATDAVLPQVTQASNSESVHVDLPQIVQASNSGNVTANKRPRSCTQEVIGAPNHRARNGGSNFRLSLAPGQSLGLLDIITSYNGSDNGSHYKDADYQRPSYGNYQQSLPLQQQPTNLPNWLHLPNGFTPRPVNPHPAYPVVNTASFRPMVDPFPQNDSRLLHTPSQVNPYPAYPAVNTSFLRPMVHQFPQFARNDLGLLQAPSQALLPPTHFSTQSIPPAVGCYYAPGSRTGHNYTRW